MPEINLLPEEEKKQAASAQLRQKLTRYSIGVLLIAVLVSVVVFGYWAQLLQTDHQLSGKIDDLSQDLKRLSNVENLVRSLKAKLSAITAISAKTQNYESLMNDISQLIPSGVALSGATVSDKGLIALTGTGANAGEFSNLMASFLKQDSKFTGVTVESLNRDDKGVYKFVVSAKLKK